MTQPLELNKDTKSNSKAVIQFNKLLTYLNNKHPFGVAVIYTCCLIGASYYISTIILACVFLGIKSFMNHITTNETINLIMGHLSVFSMVIVPLVVTYRIFKGLKRDICGKEQYYKQALDFIAILIPSIFIYNSYYPVSDFTKISLGINGGLWGIPLIMLQFRYLLNYSLPKDNLDKK
jgi:hypothetical protein